ncbi:hypothetical protein M441DRAFT_150506 [Trichoderma asperellum CBS 433.97]|uniref:Uncharacterized protein n=1 Tax=Trichoderma asperellum (strain ATCC 204424 / CBS 433.97 / NBRC 101777) TaxID=1042311 RepID=A0A2T3YUW4_TRIA4|nr:hypothetical protein M441DRAFT_150506 [Trichoderma asperellum CBS 433.97]PTB36371.1 hypothetical protein M441DRAFT_150506 [Trichoderma asperellum CBS 433.97]
MTVKITSLLMTILYVTGLVLSAPTPKNTVSEPLAAITKPSQPQTPSTERASWVNEKRARIFRVDRALLAKLSKSNKPSKYFLDATLDLIETSQDIEGVPVFAGDKGKTVTIDPNGDLMASYGSEKFVPVWGHEGKHHRHHHRRPPHDLGQKFAFFILGFSLALAIICSCMRSLCSQEDLETTSPASDPSTAEKGTSSEVRNEKV